MRWMLGRGQAAVAFVGMLQLAYAPWLTSRSFRASQSPRLSNSAHSSEDPCKLLPKLSSLYRLSLHVLVCSIHLSKHLSIHTLAPDRAL